MYCFFSLSTGDELSDGLGETIPQRSERSHVIIWQSPTQSVPSSSLWDESICLYRFLFIVSVYLKAHVTNLPCTCKTLLQVIVFEKARNGIKRCNLLAYVYYFIYPSECMTMTRPYLFEHCCCFCVLINVAVQFCFLFTVLRLKFSQRFANCCAFCSWCFVSCHTGWLHKWFCTVRSSPRTNRN